MEAALLRWAVLALMLVAAAVAGYVHGLRYEQGKQARERAEEQKQWIDLAKVNAEADRKAQAKVAKALEDEREARTKDGRDYERRLRNAPRGTLVEKSCPDKPAGTATDSAVASGASAAGGGADDDGRLSADGRELWNAALGAGATAAERAEWLVTANAAPGPASIRSAFTNLRANLSLLGECRTREALTQAWMCEKGLAACQ